VIFISFSCSLDKEDSAMAQQGDVKDAKVKVTVAVVEQFARKDHFEGVGTKVDIEADAEKWGFGSGHAYHELYVQERLRLLRLPSRAAS
jgi:hypothetical protein